MRNNFRICFVRPIDYTLYNISVPTSDKLIKIYLRFSPKPQQIDLLVSESHCIVNLYYSIRFIPGANTILRSTIHRSNKFRWFLLNKNSPRIQIGHCVQIQVKCCRRVKQNKCHWIPCHSATYILHRDKFSHIFFILSGVTGNDAVGSISLPYGNARASVNIVYSILPFAILKLQNDKKIYQLWCPFNVNYSR